MLNCRNLNPYVTSALGDWRKAPHGLTAHVPRAAAAHPAAQPLAAAGALQCPMMLSASAMSYSMSPSCTAIQESGVQSQQLQAAIAASNNHALADNPSSSMQCLNCRHQLLRHERRQRARAVQLLGSRRRARRGTAAALPHRPPLGTAAAAPAAGPRPWRRRWQAGVQLPAVPRGARLHVAPPGKVTCWACPCSTAGKAAK